jgi:hypothetical protein
MFIIYRIETVDYNMKKNMKRQTKEKHKKKVKSTARTLDHDR